MKISKNNLDKLILEVMSASALVSANPLQDNPNPANQSLLQQKITSTQTQEKVDPNKVQVDKAVLRSLHSTKENIRNNLNKMPANQLINQVSTLLNQLNFLDSLVSKI